jgi:hypothetical protein
VTVVAGALAVAAERLGRDASAVLSRLAAPLGHEARDALAALAVLDPAARTRRRAELAATARTPLPSGLRAVHPSWLEAALADMPARARTALATSSTDPVDVWLARWVTAALPPMPAEQGWLPADPLAWLSSIGADQLAFALGEPARAMPALAAAWERIQKPPRKGQLGPTRAALARCRGVSLDDDLALPRLAARALAPHLAADPLAQLQLIHSVPRPIGLVLARELAAHAGTPVDQAPAWPALVAR